jgi:hypothetical protein
MNTLPGLQQWPIIRTHEQAYCYRQHCGQIIGPGTPSGFPVTRGAYVAHCPTCDCKTWYDIAAEVRAE